MVKTHKQVIEDLIDALEHIAAGEFTPDPPLYIRKFATKTIIKARKDLGITRRLAAAAGYE